MFFFDEMLCLSPNDAHATKYAEIPDRTLPWFLENSAETHPTQTALSMQGHAISYKTLNALSDSVASGLHATGFRQGERAVIYMPRCPQFVICYYGILKAGGVVIAADPLSSKDELAHLLVNCGAETAFMLSQYYEPFKSIQAQTLIQRIIVSSIKEYLPTHLRLWFGAVHERRKGYYAKLRDGDIAFLNFLKLGRKSGKLKMVLKPDSIAVIPYAGKTAATAMSHRDMTQAVGEANALSAENKLTQTLLQHNHSIMNGEVIVFFPDLKR